MHPSRTLTLRREVLAELDAAGLRAVVGGDATQLGSCLDFVSCNPLDCVTRYTVLTTAVRTVEADCATSE